mmetsp:Transcript_12547/g.21780  ORF Transcript_12547/g.21780 Transcript_12547/m.21780 type:complete len:265 (-) Transcript_12547:212-1006(-)
MTFATEFALRNNRSRMHHLERLRLNDDLDLGLGGIVGDTDSDFYLVRILSPVASLIHTAFLLDARTAGHAGHARGQPGHAWHATRRHAGHPSESVWVAGWRQTPHQIGECVSTAGDLGSRWQLVPISENKVHRLRDDALWVLRRLDACSLSLHILKLLRKLLLNVHNRVPEFPCDDSFGKQPPVASRISVNLLKGCHVPNGPLHEAELKHVLGFWRQKAHPEVAVAVRVWTLPSHVLFVLASQLFFDFAVSLDLSCGQVDTRIG